MEVGAGALRRTGWLAAGLFLLKSGRAILEGCGFVLAWLPRRLPDAGQTAPAADGDGRITGPDAVKFFERSGLPRETLAKVWAGADSSRRGFLDFQAFCKVGWAGPA